MNFLHAHTNLILLFYPCFKEIPKLCKSNSIDLIIFFEQSILNINDVFLEHSMILYYRKMKDHNIEKQARLFLNENKAHNIILTKKINKKYFYLVFLSGSRATWF